MSKVTDLVKRLLIGRALRSTQLHEQLLPKRIALPVFASDALSSVAYAPQEILVILSLAGVSFYHFSPWIAVAVVVVMLTVVASYRQNVHAYPSGGGDYEVATTNLGRNAGLTVASALHGRLRADRRGVGRHRRRLRRRRRSRSSPSTSRWSPSSSSSC